MITSDERLARQLLLSGEARALRLRAGLRLEDVAAQLPGRPALSTVSRWERGERMPTRANAVALAGALNRICAQVTMQIADGTGASRRHDRGDDLDGSQGS